MVSSGNNLLPYGGELYYVPNAFTHEESYGYFNQLFTEISWKQEPIKIFGKEVMQPRLTAWYGDVTKPYAYSGITMTPLQWISPLLAIKSVADRFSGAQSSSALLNLYRDGNDGLGWHRDNEKVLGPAPTISSVSFGAVRRFQLRDYREKNNLISLDLLPGSVVVMKGASQQVWEHRVVKTKKDVGVRINVTFRIIN